MWNIFLPDICRVSHVGLMSYLKDGNYLKVHTLSSLLSLIHEIIVEQDQESDVVSLLLPRRPDDLHQTEAKAESKPWL